MVADFRVANIMSTDVISVSPGTPVTEIARLMVEHGVSGIPVVIDGQVRGIVTEADLVSREIEVDPPVYGTFLDAVFRLPWDHSDDELRRVLATTAGELMSSPAVTIEQTATVHDVASLMYKRHVNPVPVVDQAGRLVGVVSRSDIIRLIASDE